MFTLLIARNFLRFFPGSIELETFIQAEINVSYKRKKIVHRKARKVMIHSVFYGQ